MKLQEKINFSKLIREARGDSQQEIVQQMNLKLSTDAVKALCRGLGILVTSFAFRNTLNRQTIFFEEGKDPETYRTKYISDGSSMEFHDELIHQVFVDLRSIHVNKNETYCINGKESRFLHDFIAHLPLSEDSSNGVENRSKLKAEKVFRDEYHVHYCSIGEMVTYQLVWRLLCFIRDLGFQNESLQDIDLHNLINNKRTSPLKWEWLGEEMYTREFCSNNEIRGRVKKFLSNNPATNQTWKDELAFIGLGEEGWGWEPMRLFLQKAFSLEVSSLNSDEIPVFIMNHISIFLNFLHIETNELNVSQTIYHLERYSRFPILAFYFWSLVDSAPRSFCASPVWYSQFHNDIHHDGSTRILGISVSSLKPMTNLDFTIPQNKKWIEQFATQVHPSDLFEFLRSLALPLVEGGLYQETYKYSKSNEILRDIIEEKKHILDSQSEDSKLQVILNKIND